jgi:small subunit ribosomal protein S8e
MGTTWNLRSNRRPTGGKLKSMRKKRRGDRGSTFLETRIDRMKTKQCKMRGGKTKSKLISAEYANVCIGGGKIRKAKITSVKDNMANPHYIRRNIITRGAVIETEIGPARVTSRPGQSGVINAVLVGEAKKKE